MNSSQKSLIHFFDDYVFGSMRTELDWAIRGGAVQLAALGLVTYTEFLGGIATGNLGIKGHSAKNFRAFLKYLGSEYELLSQQQGVDIYERVRCGLAHQYFMKPEAMVWAEASAPCGIISSANGPTIFIVPVYRDHLFDGARRLRDEMLEDGTSEAVSRAKKALSNIDKPIL